MTHSLLSPTATLLVGSLRAAITPGGGEATVAARVSRTLEGHLTDPFLLSAAQREPDPNAYRQHVLHVTLAHVRMRVLRQLAAEAGHEALAAILAKAVSVVGPPG